MMCVKEIYSTALNIDAEMMTKRLKEKMMTNKEPMMESIIIAKSDMERPHIIARLRMFLYT